MIQMTKHHILSHGKVNIIYDDSDIYSRVTINGSYGIDSVRSVFVDVDTITAEWWGWLDRRCSSAFGSMVAVIEKVAIGKQGMLSKVSSSCHC